MVETKNCEKCLCSTCAISICENCTLCGVGWMAINLRSQCNSYKRKGEKDERT